MLKNVGCTTCFSCVYKVCLPHSSSYEATYSVYYVLLECVTGFVSGVMNQVQTYRFWNDIYFKFSSNDS